MKRTQIYLSTEQWETLRAISARTHQSLSALVRAAIAQKYLCAKAPGFEASMRGAFGIWKNRGDIGDTGAYVRGLRKGTRLQRLQQRMKYLRN